MAHTTGGRIGEVRGSVASAIARPEGVAFAVAWKCGDAIMECCSGAGAVPPTSAGNGLIYSDRTRLRTNSHARCS